VSVIVCTSAQRVAALRACVASLRALRVPCFEVVIVDNGRMPTVAADDLVRVGCRVVHEPVRGLDRARNRGVREARGEIVAFIDDDCEADADWLMEVRAVFADPTVGGVTGRVLPARLELRSERWFEGWFSFDRGPDPVRVSADTPGPFLAYPGVVGTGCNMAFRRDVVIGVGGFDEAIEVGTLVGGGGDLDMFARVLDAGAPILYAPGAVVLHHHRTTVVSLCRQFWGYGVSTGALTCKFVAVRRDVRRAVLRHAVHRVRFQHARRLRARVRGEDVVPVGLMLVDMAGMTAGPVLYALSLARRRLDRTR
jgi:GT2 family glycosyltransferase